MPTYRRPRGAADVLPEEQRYWRHIEAVAAEQCRRYGYQRIDTPVFEDAGLFTRAVGAGTDIVEKETYTFQDRGGDSLTLRPEGTAPVCRAYLEHGMFNLPQPVRLYYFCPVFRYERPQAGRYREHHQFGIEALGEAGASIDAEVVQFAWELTDALGLKGLTLLINSIGDRACRPGYVQRLKEYYASHIDEVCHDCRARLERAPLRLLDCKQPGCQAVARGAPRSVDHLCEACAAHWDELQGHLAHLGIPYEVDHRLVRGLDYYTRTVFEIQPPDERGQSTILGGGRYDGLIEELGGRPTPGIGFATGMERLALNLVRQDAQVAAPSRPVVVAYVGAQALREALRVAGQLRSAGLTAVLAPNTKSVKGQLRFASAQDAPYVVILGEDELRKGVASLKEMSSGDQREVPLAELASALKQGQD
jgi:histidyl-tRNA synthetase